MQMSTIIKEIAGRLRQISETIKEIADRLRLDLLHQSKTMQMSESIKEVTGALAKAQISIDTVVKENKAIVKSKKGSASSYQYNYASLDAVWNACKKALSDNGLAIVQTPSTNGNLVTITTLLSHESGEWIKGDLTIPSPGNGPQDFGSAITYGRRYSLTAILCIAPEKPDDDGEYAQRNYTNQRNTAPPAQQQSSAQTQQKPPQQQSSQQPPTQTAVSNGQKLREYLKQAGCQSKSDALLVLNWLSNNAFTDSDQAMKNEQAAGNLLSVVQTKINDGLKVQQFLQLANDWKVANEAFPVNEGANQ